LEPKAGAGRDGEPKAERRKAAGAGGDANPAEVKREKSCGDKGSGSSKQASGERSGGSHDNGGGSGERSGHGTDKGGGGDKGGGRIEKRLKFSAAAPSSPSVRADSPPLSAAPAPEADGGDGCSGDSGRPEVKRGPAHGDGRVGAGGQSPMSGDSLWNTANCRLIH
jgi:hypothetical protein